MMEFGAPAKLTPAGNGQSLASFLSFCAVAASRI